MVVICTRNPDEARIHRVFRHLLEQSVKDFDLVLVDNGSEKPIIIPNDFGSRLQVVREPTPGLAHARHSALSLCRNYPLVIFVDDDNYLARDYVAVAIQKFLSKPSWGAFGGKQLLPEDFHAPRWKKSLLPYLAVRDLGAVDSEALAQLQWSIHEPAGAGMCIRGEVAGKFLEQITGLDHDYFNLGRLGSTLLSGDDSYIARQAAYLNLSWGYSPELVLTHDIMRFRLKIKYLMRLMFGYGISDVSLAKCFPIVDNMEFPQTIRQVISSYLFILKNSRTGWLTGIRVFGQFFAVRRLSKQLS